MKTNGKIVVAGGIGLLALWYFTRGKNVQAANTNGSYSNIGVVKTTGECAPGGTAYGSAACTATSDNPDSTPPADTSGNWSAGTADFVPSLPPKNGGFVPPVWTSASRVRVPGSDGPIVGAAQLSGGLGSRIDDRLTAALQPSKAGHR